MFYTGVNNSGLSPVGSDHKSNLNSQGLAVHVKETTQPLRIPEVVNKLANCRSYACLRLVPI